MHKLRTIIVDDEPLAIDGIKELLKDETSVEVVAECGNGKEAVKAINNLMPDLVFLDIEMPGLKGIDILKQITLPKLPAIVFVTAYDQYAVRAFEENALDYLLKPFTNARFKKTLERAITSVKNSHIVETGEKLAALISRGSTTTPLTQENEYPDRIKVRSEGGIVFVNVNDICWIEAMDYYANIHTASANYLIRKSLTGLEQLLGPVQFLRIHRSTLVNAGMIRKLTPKATGDYEVTLATGTKLKLSRTRKHLLNRIPTTK